MARPKHIPQPAWNKALEMLETAPKKWQPPSKASVGSSRICAGGYISKDGTTNDGYSDYSSWKGNVCHGFMQRGLSEDSVIFFNTLVPVKDEKIQAALEAFCTWGKEKSPFRNFILNDTIESMWNGGLVIDFVKCPGHIALMICKLFRCAYEDTFRLPIWHGLVERGVHPMIALCFSQCCDSSLLNNGRQTHNTCVFPPKDNDDAKRMLTIEHLPERKDSINTWDTHKIFTSGDFDAWDKTPLPFSDKKTATQRIPDGWGGFIEKKVPVSVEVVAELLKKWEKELKK